MRYCATKINKLKRQIDDLFFGGMCISATLRWFFVFSNVSSWAVGGAHPYQTTALLFNQWRGFSLKLCVLPQIQIYQWFAHAFFIFITWTYFFFSFFWRNWTQLLITGERKAWSVNVKAASWCLPVKSVYTFVTKKKKTKCWHWFRMKSCSPVSSLQNE